jgi:peptide/nickel transport system substrate-binding protein
VRVAGVQSGEFDYADNINTDQYPLFKDSPQVRPIVVTLGRVLCAFFNLKSPATADVKVRQAALAALDMEAILKAGWGTPEFYRLNPCLIWKGTPWYTEAGKESYNQKNLNRAKQLLKESRYKGEPIRWMTTKEFPWLYQESVVAGQAMQAAGLNVKLEMTDWATIVNRRTKPEGWEIFGGSPTFVPDPLFLAWNQPGTFPGWWDSPAANAQRRIQVEKTDFKERFAAWEAFQRIYYEEVPFLKFGDANELLITGPKVRGVARSATLMFWNAWFAK